MVISWCFADVGTSKSTAILRQLESHEALVPSIWPLEIANVLVVSERRRRIKPAETRRFLSLLVALPIRVDPTPAVHVFDIVLDIARKQKLSAYDAAYLDLSLREDIPLATLDRGLQKAAKRMTVEIL